MAQDYTVQNFAPWKDRETGQNTTDQYGNVKGSLQLAGIAEPVDATFKNPPEVGKPVYGHIEEYQTRSGSTRQRFKRDQREQFGGGQQASFGGGSKPAYKDNSDGMRQGMCFNNAANYIVGLHANSKVALPAEDWAKAVYDYANALYKLGDLGGTSETLKAQANPTTSLPTGNPARLKQGQDPWPIGGSLVAGGLVKDDAEAQSLYNSVAQVEEVFNGEGIDLSDFPDL